MYRIILLFCTLLYVQPTQLVLADNFDHSDWGDLLIEHVRVLEDGRASQVDYAGFARQREALSVYLGKMSAVSRVEFDSWPTDEQLAFLLNAYNSWTVEFILTKYPDLDSIKDLGSLFQSPWKKSFIPLLGKKRSLDDIEHGLIRGSERYNDPRIHFAANCASIGCPALRAEPYLGTDLQRQLEEATSLFLKDRSRNRLDSQVLKVSVIFKWYREDFKKGWKAIESLEQFFAFYAGDLELTEEQMKQLTKGKIKIEFLDYDWKLNSLQE